MGGHLWVSSPPEPLLPPLFTDTVQEWQNGRTALLDSQAWTRPGDTTHLLHTMAMTTTAMRKTRPAAEEPMMSGSFSWMLVWYSAGEKAQRSVLSLALGIITPRIPTTQVSLDPRSVPLLAEHLSCSGGELAVTSSQVTLDKSVNCPNSQFLVYKMGIIMPASQFDMKINNNNNLTHIQRQLKAQTLKPNSLGLSPSGATYYLCDHW